MTEEDSELNQKSIIELQKEINEYKKQERAYIVLLHLKDKKIQTLTSYKKTLLNRINKMTDNNSSSIKNEYNHPKILKTFHTLKNILKEKEGKVPNVFRCFGTNSSAKDEIATIFGDRTYFQTPKPLKLIKELVRATSNKDSIILDFFAGSGTTGHAVVDLNKEDRIRVNNEIIPLSRIDLIANRILKNCNYVHSKNANNNRALKKGDGKLMITSVAVTKRPLMYQWYMSIV